MTSEERKGRKRHERINFPIVIRKIEWSNNYCPDSVQVYFRGLFSPVPKVYVCGDYNDTDFIETQLVESDTGEVVHRSLDGSIVRLLKRWENKQFDGQIATFSRLKIIYGERDKSYRLKATWYQRNSCSDFSIVCAIESEPFTIRSTKRFVNDSQLENKEPKRIKISPIPEPIAEPEPKPKPTKNEDEEDEPIDDDDSSDATYTPSPAIMKTISKPNTIPLPATSFGFSNTSSPPNTVQPPVRTGPTISLPISLARLPFLNGNQQDSTGLPKEFAQFLRQINTLKTENVDPPQ